jgi:2-oxoglutarate dehydrogenase E2 component (dihydrolipoamide succinyltransferase)
MTFATRQASSVPVECPSLGDSVLEGDLVEWKKQVGDWIDTDETLCVLETAKVVIDIPAPCSGVITAQKISVGDIANVGDVLCEIDSSAAKPAGSAAPKADAKADAPKADAPKADAPKAEAPKAAAPKADAPTAASATSTPSAGKAREERRVKMTRMRQTIAKRLKDSQNSMAMLTTFNEIDMSAAQKLRADYKDLFEKKHGSKLGFMSIFMKACASALQAFPDVNAYIDADTNEIVYRNFVDISIAVATPTGLVVPVIRGVEDLDFAGCEKAVAEYGAKARNGTIAMEDFVGGTFTISNGGVYGSLFGTPIINPPQSAILGMHSIVQRPVAVDGKVEIRPMMYVACTYDHRLLDGSTAVQFLKHIKQCVEDPRRLVLNM